jgi:hypothetical protein
MQVPIITAIFIVPVVVDIGTISTVAGDQPYDHDHDRPSYIYICVLT